MSEACLLAKTLKRVKSWKVWVLKLSCTLNRTNEIFVHEFLFSWIIIPPPSGFDELSLSDIRFSHQRGFYVWNVTNAKHLSVLFNERRESFWQFSLPILCFSIVGTFPICKVKLSRKVRCLNDYDTGDSVNFKSLIKSRIIFCQQIFVHSFLAFALVAAALRVILLFMMLPLQRGFSQLYEQIHQRIVWHSPDSR